MTLSPSLTKKILLALLLLFGILALTLSLNIPLGESPDELAHFKYIQFLAEHGRPPTNMDERETVGYRSKWPPLYQSLVAPIVRLSQSDGIDSLRRVGYGSRNAIALDGLTSMVFLHTEDELAPFSGIARSWHAARALSAVLGIGTLLLLFLTLQYEFSATISLLMVMAAALTPEFTTISAVLNDDNLLGFLTALFLWIMWPMFKQEGSWQLYLALGCVAGLAMTTKYSVIFLPFSLAMLHLLLKRWFTLKQIIAFAGGYLLTISWWVLFVIYNFNKIETYGWLKGIIAPFVAGGVDPSSRYIAAALRVGAYDAPAFDFFNAPWGEWLQTFLVSAYAPRSEIPIWLWLPLLMGLMLILLGAVLSLRRREAHLKRVILFSLAYFLLFIPLPLYRFIITSNIIETAQGRHILFPALTPLAMLLGFGLQYWLKERWMALALAGLVLFFGMTMALVVWPQITFADFPYLPVKRSLDAAPEVAVNAAFDDGIHLLGLNFPDGVDPNALPVTLIWQAKAVPSADYTVQLQLQDDNGRLLGVWQGQPVNGRYPTRVWNEGDVIYDTIWLPVLGSASIKALNLSVALRAEGGDGGAARIISLPDSVVGKFNVLPPISAAPFQARLLPRGDRFNVSDPYRYRSTIAFSLNIPATAKNVALLAPDGQRYLPSILLSGRRNAIALFNVDWTWPAGDYDLVLLDESGQPKRAIEEIARVWNRQRLLEPPPITRPVNAIYDNDQFELLGYDLPTNRAQPGDSFEVTLYWKALRATNTSYKVFNHLLDSAGTQYGGRDRLPQGYYSTILWNPGEIVVDRYPVPVSSNAPDGIYWLDVGLYPEGDATTPPLPLVGSGVNSVRLGPIKVGGQPAESRPTSPPTTPRREQFGDVIALTGYSMAQDLETNTLALDLYWEASAPPPIDYTLFIHIIDQAGAVVAQADAPPVKGLYPTSFWGADEQIFDSRQILLNELPPGQYQIRLGWYDPVSGQRLFVPYNPEGFVMMDEFAVE